VDHADSIANERYSGEEKKNQSRGTVPHIYKADVVDLPFHMRNGRLGSWGTEEGQPENLHLWEGQADDHMLLDSVGKALYT
jgi:hypothetical protein